MIYKAENFSIDLKNISHLIKPLEKKHEQKIQQLYSAWIKSTFAGFRKLLQTNSKEAPPLDEIKKLARLHSVSAQGKAIKNFVLLGTGGSSLGAEALVRALRSDLSEPKFYFLDNNDPDYFSDHLNSWNAEETLFYVVSKSGGTLETIAQFLVCIEWLKNRLPENEWIHHIVVCTDPAKGDLRKLLTNYEFSHLDIPPSVGGRFSALTPVGLFPAAFADLKIAAIMDGARSITNAWEINQLTENPAYLLANALTSNLKEFPITVIFPYSSYLKTFSRWFSQLWAESLGKNGLGLTPYPALGTTDQHSQIQLYMDGPRDKVIGFIEVKKFKQPLFLPEVEHTQNLDSFTLLKNHSMENLFQAEFRATRAALNDNNIPNFTISLDSISEASLGALIFFWEWVTVYAGALLEIDPFQQPGVEKGKLLTKEYLKNLSKGK